MKNSLAALIAQAMPVDGRIQPLPGVHLVRASEPTAGLHGVSEPSFCVIAQGRKEVYVGDACYSYDMDHYLLTTLEMPVVGRIVEASKPRPYLSLRLVLDPAVVGSVTLDAGVPPPPRQSNAKAMVVSSLDADLLDATVRLMKLVAVPQQARVLLPLLQREIIFRLLLGQQGHRLRHLPLWGGASNLIARAVDRLRTQFDQPLRIESLARELGMSPSGFHQHFKAVTDMSPLQFQKHIRLHEARRLMMGDDMDAASAAFKVGYNDPSHFSRDYKHHFGTPPARDVERMRSTLGVQEPVS